MRQLIYTSVETPELGEGGVFQIVQASARKNTDSDLCGFLIYLNGSFLQLLEGSDEAVQQLFERICTDPRHKDVDVVWDETTRTRYFERWKMQRIAVTSTDSVLVALGDLGNPIRQSGHLPIVEKFVRSKLPKAA